MKKVSYLGLVKEDLIIAILVIKLAKTIGEFLPVAIELFNMAVNYLFKQIR